VKEKNHIEDCDFISRKLFSFERGASYRTRNEIFVRALVAANLNLAWKVVSFNPTIDGLPEIL